MIVKMRHFDLVCVASQREATLERLRQLGIVHLDLSTAVGAEVAEAKGSLSEAERAVRLIRKARGKGEEPGNRERTVEEVLSIDRDRETLKAERERLEREIRTYEPYGDFDPELAKHLIEKGVDIHGLGGETPLFPAKLPAMRLAKMREKLDRVVNRMSIDEAKLADCDESFILRRFPSLKDRIAFCEAKELLQDHGAVAVLSGWLPVTKERALMDEVTQSRADLFERTKALGWGVLLRDAAEGETPPTLIEPPKIFRPVKALFEGLGIAPAYVESDVSIPFMCYFSLFFAMLVGDGAYGAIFLAGTLAMKRKLPKSWFVLLTVFSSATILWGALSNTWFGAGIPWCENWPTVRWLAGADAPAGHEYDNMMFLCFTIGVSHLMLARLWNAFARINDRSCLSEFGWAGIVLFMYVLTNSIVGIFGGVPTWCFWMFGVSFLTVFWQAKGMDKGMLFLSAMSVLGDIISYVRLFAVGLASVKVAQNFNSMAIDLGLPIWLKWLPLVVILLIGHGLNLAMAGLSVLVHAVRLNTLEFSNHKGVSWAGYAFRAFARNAK